MEKIYHTKNLDAAEGIPQSGEDISAFDIIHLFGKETLEEIQEKISKATGLAFVTVDYKGEPVTDCTSFTGFCAAIRNNKKTLTCCKSSDAYGAIQAAVTQKASVYFCPCGLLEVAIPIVVNGHYLGGFIGGQIRCEDAPANVCRLSSIMGQNLQMPEEITQQKLFEQVPVLTYEKFVNVAELVSLIINQLSEKEMTKKMQKVSLEGELLSVREENSRLIVENQLRATEMASLMGQMNPYFLVNTLTSVSNLATIEGADKTNEMLVMFAEFAKSNLTEKKSIHTISEEIENIERYLQMQKIRFGEQLESIIQIPDQLKVQKIPTHILLPFVENAIFNGISLKQGGGKVVITGRDEKEYVEFQIEDDGPGYNQEQLKQYFHEFKGGYEGDSIAVGMANARQRIITLFGKEYDISMEMEEGRGGRVKIRYPKYFDERMGYHVSDINR